MINLDDKEAVIKAQGGDIVLTSIDSFGKQLKQAYHEIKKVEFPEKYKKAKNILVCGMGGSRFPALIIKELYKKFITVPYLTNDDYDLPAFVNEDTLVVISSYSGTTEESVTCGKKAIEKGAMVTGISAGGDVEKILKEKDLPQYVFNPVHNPSKQPRIGFGYSVGGHLGLLENLGFLSLGTDEMDHAVAELENLSSQCKLTSMKDLNPAKKLAHELYQKYPYYIVSEFLTGVGNAIQNQTNETAKSISSYRVIPELNHHMMEGLKFPEAHKNIAVFILFYSSFYSPPIQKRFHITKDVVEQNGAKVIWHELKGKTPLEQAIELMSFGSYLSMYMSALYEQDPTAIPYVDYFKKKLKEMS